MSKKAAEGVGTRSTVLLGLTEITTRQARRIAGMRSVLDLARKALATGDDLAATAAGAGFDKTVALDAVRLSPPVDHVDPTHLLLSGTGLTRLGSGESRDRMHRDAAADTAPSDSTRMIRMGLADGRPAPGEAGIQPEWFDKGDGAGLVASGEPLVSPAFPLRNPLGVVPAADPTVTVL